jgi:hypothetical protein
MAASTAPVTVVSAYYPVPSKHSVEEYLRWIHEFWPRMQCAMVFFTEPAMVEPMRKLLGAAAGRPIEIIGLPFSDFTAFHRYPPTLWAQAHQLDPEKGYHTPELYALWYEKKEFVLRTAARNPFQSEFFVWVDAGICRWPDWTPLIQGFPAPEFIPRGSMLTLQIEPGVFDTSGTDYSTISSVGGGILAADAPTWSRWSAAYDATLTRFVAEGRFIGKDQVLMATMIAEDRSLATLVQAPQALGPIRKWFYLLFHLAGMQVANPSAVLTA